MARLNAFAEKVQVIVDRNLTPEARGRIIAGRARELIAEADVINERALGFVPEHKTFVDGREGAPLESVAVPGTILISYDLALMVGVFEWIDEQLIVHSPVGDRPDPHPGLYQKSHVFLADGIEADWRSPPKEATEFAFLNNTPYSRKIEGTSGKPGESSQAPDGVYQGVAALALGRYGNLARIVFTYRAPLIAYSSKRAKNDARVPAIVITLKG